MLTNIYIIAHYSTTADVFNERQRLSELFGEARAGRFFAHPFTEQVGITQKYRLHERAFHGRQHRVFRYAM